MKKFIEKALHDSGRFKSLYVKVFHPSAIRWASYLRKHGSFEKIGEGTAINRGAVVTDPYLVSIGNNCTLSDCYLVGHDGSIGVVQNFAGYQVDAVGPITIKDNCFIGINSVILRNVTIGENSIVAAGSVVVNDVPKNSVVAGVPAQVVSTIDSYAAKLKAETALLPWNNIIEQRVGTFDPSVEQELRAKRKKHYWGHQNG